MAYNTPNKGTSKGKPGKPGMSGTPQPAPDPDAMKDMMKDHTGRQPSPKSTKKH